MALTFNSGMTVDNAAQALTNVSAVGFAGLNDHTSLISSFTGAMGANSIGIASWDANGNWAILYDYFTDHASVALNLTTVGNEVLAIWFAAGNPGLALALASGGVYVIASSSTDVGATVPTAYRKWYVSGSDILASRDSTQGPWYLVMIDTRKAASVADVGAFSLAAVHRIGIGMLNVAVPPGVGGPPPESLFFGGVMHGRPIYQVTGDGATTATWAAFLIDSGTTVKNGLIEDRGGGLFRVSCGFRFGNSAQAATTTFVDATGKRILFKRQTYYNAGVVDALNYSDYYLIDAQGAASFKTSITLGTVVGAGDARQGVQGGEFLTGDQTNISISADFTSANLSAVNMYGVQWVGLKGGLKFDGATVGLVISNTFQRSGEVDLGATGNGAFLLNCTLIDPEGGTAQNYGLKLPSVHNIKNVSFITSGTPATQHMLDLPSSGTYTVTMDNLKFFGTYSGTVLEGDLSSATLSTVTGAAINGANPDATKFSKTGNASSTIVVNNSVTISVTAKDALTGALLQNVRVAVYKSGNILAGQELLNALTNASGIATTTFNYSVDQAIVARLRCETPLLAKPVNAAFSTALTGGTLAAGTYWYRVTATNDLGETLASVETSQVTTGATSTVTVNWGAVVGATGYKVYGRSTGAELLMATVGAILTWTDTGAVTPAGALPVTNTSGTGRYVAVDATGTITINGFTATFTMVADAIAAAAPL
jgi:hypothetical protein